MNPITGDISTVGRMPFNCTTPYNLAVSAQTVGVVASSNTPAQSVTVYCEQELDPQFYQNPYVVNMDELTPPNGMYVHFFKYINFQVSKYKQNH